MTQVRIREVAGTVQALDQDSLLSGPTLERIVEAVLKAVAQERGIETSRGRDTRIGDGCCDETGDSMR